MYASVDKFYFLFYILNVYISYLETSLRKKKASAQNWGPSSAYSPNELRILF